MTTMPYLSDDLVEEILSRVPETSLKRLRSTCKRWNHLFKDTRFARKHIEKAAKEFLVLMLTKHFRIGPLSINLHDGNRSAKLNGMLNQMDPFSSAQFEIYHVFHCDGLLLCTLEDESRTVVWNPLTGETRWIEVGNLRQRGRSFVLGYYQDNKKRNGKSYKILSFDSVSKESAIYELNSDSWRILGDDIAPCWFLCQMVSLKGKAYWFSKEETLLGFDFATEKARPVPVPYDDCYNYESVCLSVVRDEKLSVLLQREITSKIEIWVTDKIDESWSKVLALDLSPDLPMISDFGSCGML